MKRIKTETLSGALVLLLVFAGCTFHRGKMQQFEEIPSMLNILTNKVQFAVEEGFFDTGGEKAVLEHVNNINPKIINWFAERNYELRVGVLADTAIVLVCAEGKPIYEDTYCDSGAPDKDHRSLPLESCEITMSEVDVTEICE